MALTPEDVVNKRFQPTKFREGYDQDEVDDFLDEVVVELRRLNQENEELRQRLIQSEQQRAQGAPAMAAPAAPPVAAPMAPPPAAAPAPAPAPSFGSDPQGDTNNLLQLARTLHEQHVREGIEKRDALIAEGQAAAERAVQEAEQQQRQQINGLEQERQTLEKRIEELRNFERDYRAKLKGYIEGQLRELDDVTVGAAQPAAAQPASALVTGPQSFPAPPQQQSFPAPPAPAPQGFPQGYGQAEAPLPPQAAPTQQDPAFGGAPAPQAPQGYPGFAGN